MKNFLTTALVIGIVFLGIRPAHAQNMSEEEEARVNQSVDDYVHHNLLNTLNLVQTSVSQGTAPQVHCTQEVRRSENLPAALRRVDVSFVGGNLLGGKDGSKQDKTYQLAFGQRLNGNWGVEVSEYNEGDPSNNHRDGFPVIATYEFKINSKARVKVGAGPYFTMNTTTINGSEHDEKRLGALASAIFLYRIAPNLDAEARFNQAIVPGEPGSKVLLVGLHGEFDGLSADLLNGKSGHREIAVMTGYSHENRAGSKTLEGYQAEYRVVKENRLGYSVSVTQDKDPAIAGQVWYVRPLNEKWTASAGAGLQENLAGSHKPAALVSIDLSRKVGKNWSVGFRANRRVSGDDQDRDNFYIVGKREF